MMSAQSQPQVPATVSAFWRVCGAKFAELLMTGAHAELIIVVRDGKPQLVRVNQTFLATDVVPKCCAARTWSTRTSRGCRTR